MWPEQAFACSERIHVIRRLPRERKAYPQVIATQIVSGFAPRVPVTAGTIPGTFPESPVFHTTVRPRASGQSFGTAPVLRSPGSDRTPRIPGSGGRLRREVRRAQPEQTIGQIVSAAYTGRERVSSEPRDSVLQDLVERPGRSALGPRGASFQDERPLQGGTLESDRRLSVELARRGTAISDLVSVDSGPRSAGP